jgi:hypothetical protein
MEKMRASQQKTIGNLSKVVDFHVLLKMALATHGPSARCLRQRSDDALVFSTFPRVATTTALDTFTRGSIYDAYVLTRDHDSKLVSTQNYAVSSTFR